MTISISNPLKTPAPTDGFSKIQQLMTTCKMRVERTLEQWLPPVTAEPADLHKAMRYAALAGGKYIRPLLVYTTGEVLDIKPDTLDGPACAVELIHAYSLVHDDLPAMDDDDLRRGKPTCHKAYGEALAILAGDTLQALAFHILAHDPAIKVPPTQRIKMIDTLAVASGSLGMAGGQAIDLAALNRNVDIKALEDMHHRKTGALIQASVTLAASCHKDIDDRLLGRLEQYARCVGLAFQVRDDILDVEGDTATLGKTQGADIARNKATYPALLGMAGAKQQALELHEEAISCLDTLGTQAEPLRWISEYIVQRPN